MTPGDRDAMAAEYAMGLLEGEEVLRAERLAGSDRGFAQAVSDWRERLAEFDVTAPAAAPPADLWDRIARDLDLPEPASAADTAASVVIPDPRNAFAALWRSLAFWRLAGLASAAAALLLAVGLAVLANREAGASPVLVAVLLTDANRPAAIVNAYRDGRAELVPLEGLDVPQGRALEIWTQVDPARGPVSLGVLDRARTVPLRLDEVLRARPSQFFAISLEPAGGSPTGRPTGPVLMQGTTSTAL